MSLFRKIFRKFKLKKRKKEINAQDGIEIGTVITSGLEAATGAGKYGSFLKDGMFEFFKATGRFIYFPLMLLLSWAKVILLWRKAKLEKNKKSTVIAASIETIASVTLTVGVIGGFVATTAFALASPLIVAIVSAVKAVYHAISAGYYFVKCYKIKDNGFLTEQEKLKKKISKNWHRKFTCHCYCSLGHLSCYISLNNWKNSLFLLRRGNGWFRNRLCYL